jgi:hypothetical protein
MEKNAKERDGKGLQLDRLGIQVYRTLQHFVISFQSGGYCGFRLMWYNTRTKQMEI